MKKSKVLLLLSLLMLLIYGCYRYYLSLLPLMDAYGQLALRQFTSAVAVHEKKMVFQENMNEDLIDVHYTNQGKIESIDYDVILVNQMTDEMVENIEGTIKAVQNGSYQALNDSRYERYLENISANGGIITHIPLESLTSFPLFSFLRWRIPVRFQTESNVIGKVERQVESYGINNTLVALDIRLTVQQKMLLPFFQDIKNIELTFPITMKLIAGECPQTYLEGGEP